MKRIINERLAHFKNEEDRNDAITMLVFIGLKHHSIMYPHENPLRKQSLKSLCDKYYEEHTVQNINKYSNNTDDNQQKPVRKHRPDSMFHYPFADEYGSVPDVLLSAPEEKPRLLEMGGPARKRLVERVFEEMRLDRNGIRLSDLPEALHRVGITISSKLRRLLAKTRSNLVNGPINALDDNIYGDYDNQREEGGDMYVNPIMRQYMEKHVPLPLWKVIVRNFLVLMRQGRDPREVTQLFPMTLDDQGGYTRSRGSYGAKSYRRPQVDDEDYFDNLSDYDNDTFEQGEESGDVEEEDEDEEDGEDDNGVDVVLARAKAMKERQDQRKKNKKTKGTGSGSGHRRPQSRSGSRERDREQSIERQQRALAKQTQDYYRKVKTVPSRLGNVIKHDRETFQHYRKMNDTAAYEVIAKQRADHFLKATTPPVGFNNPIYQLDSKSLQARNQAGNQTNERRKASYYHDLDSGSAAIDIANGFLSSSIGQEIMSMTGSELDEDTSLSPADALEKAKQMLGIPKKQVQEHKAQLDQQFVHSTRANRDATVVINSSSGGGAGSYYQDELEQFNRRGDSKGVVMGGASSNSGFTAVRERQIQQKLDEQSKHLYGSNWQSEITKTSNATTSTKSKTVAAKTGGWVADFGPAHTHAFYTGPEKHRTTLSSSAPAMTNSNNQKRSSVGVSSSTATAIATSHRQSKQLEGGVSRDDKEERSPNDMRFTKLDPSLGKMVYAATDESVSSTSFDIAIAGAGANANTGIYDDDSLSGSNRMDDDDEDDDILAAKLRETMSLREAAGTSS